MGCESPIKIKCPKCGQIKGRTLHHCLPRRFWKKKSPVIALCRSCHTELEQLIPLKEKKPDQFYFDVVQEFLNH